MRSHNHVKLTALIKYIIWSVTPSNDKSDQSIIQPHHAKIMAATI